MPYRCIAKAPTACSVDGHIYIVSPTMNEEPDDSPVVARFPEFFESTEPPKPKRGRPRKTVVDPVEQ